MFFGSALTVFVMVGFGALLATGDDIGSETDLMISADGILNEQLMPITYLMLDGGGCDSSSRESCALGREAEGRTEPSAELPLKELGSDASYSSALSTLEFHRWVLVTQFADVL